MAQRLKKKQVVKRPKRVSQAKVVKTKPRAKSKMRESKGELTSPIDQQFELTGKRCPQGCCLDIRISTADARPLEVKGVKAGLQALSQVLDKAGLPPLASAQESQQVSH